MRDIKFRGLGINGWEYGHLVREQFRGYDALHNFQCDNNRFLEYETVCGEIIKYGYRIHRSSHQSAVWVKRETVGQFTGMKDSGDHEIFEGDVVIATYILSGDGPKKVVEWGIGAWEPFDGNCDSVKTYRYKVIGNIHEHGNLFQEAPHAD